jgi:hypothetical protein
MPEPVRVKTLILVSGGLSQDVEMQNAAESLSQDCGSTKYFRVMLVFYQDKDGNFMSIII